MTLLILLFLVPCFMFRSYYSLCVWWLLTFAYFLPSFKAYSNPLLALVGYPEVYTFQSCVRFLFSLLFVVLCFTIHYLFFASSLAHPSSFLRFSSLRPSSVFPFPRTRHCHFLPHSLFCTLFAFRGYSISDCDVLPCSYAYLTPFRLAAFPLMLLMLLLVLLCFVFVFF